MELEKRVHEKESGKQHKQGKGGQTEEGIDVEGSLTL